MKEEEIEFLRESNHIEQVYDEQSLKDSIRAWGFLKEQAKKEINPYIVMQVHELLMENVGAWSEPKLLPKYRGVLRDCDVYIGGKKALAPEALGYLIADWCVDMNFKCKNISKEARERQSKAFHVRYEKIHPFVDGNGRTGRMFMNWWRMRNGLPVLVIHEGKEQMEYYKWFK